MTWDRVLEELADIRRIVDETQEMLDRILADDAA